MRILSIETSCDETAVAIVETQSNKKSPRFVIKKSLIASQIKIHQKWGGVVPSLAKREHQKNLPLLLKKVMAEFSIFNFQFSKQKEKKFFSILKREQELAENLWPILSSIKNPDIDLIAVTQGPGLEPALWVGINTAKTLAFLWNKPIIGVNHLKGHMYSPLLNSTVHYKFPVLHLLVSGGHTELVLMKDYEKFELLGETRDDAVGETFDKVARLLDLPYPGGPEIERLAIKGNSKAIDFPRPMARSDDLDFSFSGLKTAVLYKLQAEEKIGASRRMDIAASFQEAAIDSLIIKTKKAVKMFKPKMVIISGGVSSNKRLYKKIKKEFPNTIKPEKKYALDNAVMIGIAGYFQSLASKPIKWQNLKAEANLNI